MMFHVLVLLLTVFIKVQAENVAGIPIGVLYDTSVSLRIQSYAAKAMKYANDEARYHKISWAFESTTIKVTDGHDVITNICHQMKRGILAMFSSINSASINTVRAFNSLYQIPFITWSNPINEIHVIDNNDDSTMDDNETYESEEFGDYEPAESEVEPVTTVSLLKSSKLQSEPKKSDYFIYMRPDLTQTLISLMKKYNWKKLYYVYNHEEALFRINAILNYQMEEQNTRTEVLIRKIDEISNCMNMLRTIQGVFESQHVIMMIDLDSVKSYVTFLSQIKDLGMTQLKYHYILVTLAMNELDLNDFRHGGVNITGFSIVDYDNPHTIGLLNRILERDEQASKIERIPYEAALLIDGILLLNKRIGSIIGQNPSKLFGRSDIQLKQTDIYLNETKGFTCSYKSVITPWPLGDLVFKELTNSKDAFEGLTGPAQLDSNGHRVNYTINIYQLGLNVPTTKIGSFSSEPGKGLLIEKEILQSNSSSVAKSKRVVISILDHPFVMENPDASPSASGIDLYKGYCIDLTKKLSQMVNFSFEFRLVKDGRFGKRNEKGEWDGMVGELIRGEADIAIASLTITLQRERVIEFSKPFMSMGISIMIQKPKKEKPGVFSFMSPMSAKVWVCVIWAHIGVIVALFFVSRFSPYEWRVKNQETQIMENDFSLINSIWFCLAAFMQQGVDIAPQSISGRLVASVWWFFTLILISSYTANLAAFLTIERMTPPINNVADLAKQTEIKYGTVANGSTQSFFQSSKVPLYQSMWQFMNLHSTSVFVKSNEEGVKKVRSSDGKYAFLLESSINEYLNERKGCDTMKVGPNLDSKGYGIATPIGSDLKEAVNLAVLKLHEEGFLEDLRNKWWFHTSDCGGQAKDTSQNPLNLINVAGIFYILIIGLVLSIIIAALEVMYKAKKDAKTEKIEFKEAVMSKMRLSITGFDDTASRRSSKCGRHIDSISCEQVEHVGNHTNKTSENNHHMNNSDSYINYARNQTEV